jgi:hypothetical protein
MNAEQGQRGEQTNAASVLVTWGKRYRYGEERTII